MIRPRNKESGISIEGKKNGECQRKINKWYGNLHDRQCNQQVIAVVIIAYYYGVTTYQRIWIL